MSLFVCGAPGSGRNGPKNALGWGPEGGRPEQRVGFHAKCKYGLLWGHFVKPGPPLLPPSDGTPALDNGRVVVSVDFGKPKICNRSDEKYSEVDQLTVAGEEVGVPKVQASCLLLSSLPSPFYVRNVENWHVLSRFPTT